MSAVTKRTTDLILESLDTVPGATLEEKLKTCASCKCCERHQIKRPKVFAPWIETKYRGDCDKFYNPCPCDCRHIARFICRQIELD